MTWRTGVEPGSSRAASTRIVRSRSVTIPSGLRSGVTTTIAPMWRSDMRTAASRALASGGSVTIWSSDLSRANAMGGLLVC